MMYKLVEVIETQVRIPLWLFILVSSRLGYDVIQSLGVLGS